VDAAAVADGSGARGILAGLRRRWPWVAGFAAGLAIVLGLILVFTLVRGSEKPKNPAVAARARLKRPFDDVMSRRDQLFTQERQFLGAMGSANSKYASYEKAVSDYQAESKRISDANAPGYQACRIYAIPCPNPHYPDPPTVPDFGTDILQLRAAATGLQQLQADLGTLQLPNDLQVVESQLSSAISTLITETTHDADVLSEASASQGNCDDCVDKGKFATLRTDDALAAIRQMNIAAVNLIKKLGLNPMDYDVPGGRDLDPSDHSSLR
jgi:hypothetical protein